MSWITQSSELAESPPWELSTRLTDVTLTNTIFIVLCVHTSTNKNQVYISTYGQYWLCIGRGKHLRIILLNMPWKWSPDRKNRTRWAFSLIQLAFSPRRRQSWTETQERDFRISWGVSYLQISTLHTRYTHMGEQEKIYYICLCVTVQGKCMYRTWVIFW